MSPNSADRHYYLVYAAAREAALLAWLRRQLRDDEDVEFINVSEAVGVLMIAGPQARNILAECSDADMTNENFRWLTVRDINIGGVKTRAMRVTYCGELGWELHIPIAKMATVYRAITGAKSATEIVLIGSAALNAMRMEKAYRSGHELTPEVTLAEAGMLRFVGAQKFQGREASIAASQKWALVYLMLDEPDEVQADPLGGEAVLCDGEVVGRISSGGYGYECKHYLAFAYISIDAATVGNELEVLILSEPRRAVIVAEPIRDAQNLLLR